MTAPSFVSQFTQIAWVVKDLAASQKFFTDTMGIGGFSSPEIIRLQDFGGTYYGEPCAAESLVSLAYSGGTFIELIQPISGRSIFLDFLDKNPEGGVHHIAYSLPLAQLQEAISAMAKRGLPVITSVKHPIAEIVFFDTRREIGLFTEVMGITPEGEKAVQQMKGGQG